MIPAQQLPQPPLPPGSEITLAGSLNDLAAVVLLLGAGLIVAALLWPLIRALARRIDGGAPSTEMQTELDGLRERVRQLEEMPPRMAELEERVDFTERMVAKTREPDRLHQ
jgi:hypothetical protein